MRNKHLALDFARKLQRLMDERELTQSGLAEKIWGRYVNTEGKRVARGRDRICVWLKGKSVPDSTNLEKLAEALGVETTELMPVAIAEKVHRDEADWSITQPRDSDGKVFVQISMFVSPEVAHSIHGALIRDQREPWSRDRLAAWMHDHALDGEEPYQQ
jgi:transcriptional regulator with XRE-family HTH domain